MVNQWKRRCSVDAACKANWLWTVLHQAVGGLLQACRHTTPTCAPEEAAQTSKVPAQPIHRAQHTLSARYLHGLHSGWDGMGWDGMGWDGMGWDGMGWDGMGWDGMACAPVCIGRVRGAPIQLQGRARSCGNPHFQLQSGGAHGCWCTWPPWVASHPCIPVQACCLRLHAAAPLFSH
jgi:hypothetical protein